MRSASLALVLVAIGPVLAGCRSITARYVESPSHGEEVGGLPIVVERPRWLKVTWVRTLSQSGGGDGEGPVEIRTEILREARIFAVDLERPAAGTLDWEMEFGERCYPERIRGDVDDRGVETAAHLAESALDRGRGLPAFPESRLAGREIVIRVEIFDLAAPGGLLAPAATLAAGR